MARIIGNTTATPTPVSDWEQTDERKADYIKNKPKIGKAVYTQPDEPTDADVGAIWVDTDAEGGNASVDLDSTLTQEGMAADAKAVGDALDKKVGQTELDAVVESALTSAKESGDFKGENGQAGFYAQDEKPAMTNVLWLDTDDEMEHMEKLTFTGAVEAEYDGSKPVTVEIPQGGGGGGGEVWEEIINVTIEEDVAKIVANLAQPGRFSKIASYVYMVKQGESVAQTNVFLALNTENQWQANEKSNLWYEHMIKETADVELYGLSVFTPNFVYTQNSIQGGQTLLHKWKTNFNNQTVIEKVYLATQNWAGKFKVGSVIKVYGVRA